MPQATDRLFPRFALDAASPRSTWRGPLLAGVLAAVLSLWVATTAGASRDDHLALLGLIVAALLGLATAVRRDSSGPVVAVASLALAGLAASALLSPLRDAALRNLVVEGVAGGSFLAGVSLGSGDRRARRVFLDVVAGGALLAGLTALLTSDRATALGGTFPNHGQLAGLLAAGAVSAVGALALRTVAPAAEARSSPSLRGTADSLLRGASLARAGVAALLTALAASTGSRSALLAMGALLLLALLAREGLTFRHRLGAAAALAAGLVLIVVWMGTARRWHPGQIQSGSVDERVAVWGAALRLIRSVPLGGVGSGAFASAIWKEAPAGLGGSIEHAHSLPLELLAERGLAGFVLFALVTAAAISAVGGLRHARIRVAVEGAVLPAAVLFLQSLVDLVLSTPGLLALAFGSLGMAMGAVLGRLPERQVGRRGGGLAIAAAIALASLGWGSLSFHRARSDAALQAGKTEASLASARRSVEWFPADRVSLRRLAEAGESGRFQALAALDPRDPYAALGAAWELESEGEVEGAERELRRALANFPAGFEVHRALLEFLIRRGRLGEALVAAREIEERFESRAAAEVLRLAESLDNPLLAEELAPADAGARREIAAWLFARGDLEVALRVLPAAGPANPADVTLLRARIEAASGHPDSARETLRGLLQRDPADERAALALADLAASPDDRLEAMRILSSAFARAPQPAGAVRLLALVDAGGREEGDRWLDLQITARPDFAELFVLRSSRRASASDLSGAMADARRVIDLSPHDPQGRLLLARLLERRGMRAGARQLFLEALELEPGNVEAAEGLGRLSAAPDL